MQAESVGDLEHGSEHGSFPMAPADARPPADTHPTAPRPAAGDAGGSCPVAAQV